MTWYLNTQLRTSPQLLNGQRLKLIFSHRAQLKADEYSQEWDIKLLDDSNFDKVVELLNEGHRQTDIANELNIYKSTVSKYASRAK